LKISEIFGNFPDYNVFIIIINDIKKSNFEKFIRVFLPGAFRWSSAQGCGQKHPALLF
jgi:hypothetical protein